MGFLDREQLASVVAKADFGSTGTDSFCEVSVDDRFHKDRISSCNQDNRPMWRINSGDSRSRLDRSGWHGGHFICDECYQCLEDTQPRGLTWKATRKMLRLPSKPPLVRRVPA